MKVLKMGLFLGALACSDADDAEPAVANCSSEAPFFEINRCIDEHTGEVVGFNRGATVDGDHFLSFSIGKRAGLAPFQILRAEVTILDAQGNALGDCSPVIDEPVGVFYYGFGVTTPACDAGVNQRIYIVYDDDVRL
jgi:hypothetical protein